MSNIYEIPAANAPPEEWGRLAMSIPGWPTKYQQPSGQLVDDHGIEWVYSDPYDWDNGGSGNPVPNPDHDGTTGCLLALLGPSVHVVVGYLKEVILTGVPMVEGRHPRGMGTTLGRACIAAAATLGRWPGGGE